MSNHGIWGMQLSESSSSNEDSGASSQSASNASLGISASQPSASGMMNVNPVHQQALPMNAYQSLHHQQVHGVYQEAFGSQQTSPHQHSSASSYSRSNMNGTSASLSFSSGVSSIGLDRQHTVHLYASHSPQGATSQAAFVVDPHAVGGWISQPPEDSYTPPMLEHALTESESPALPSSARGSADGAGPPPSFVPLPDFTRQRQPSSSSSQAQGSQPAPPPPHPKGQAIRPPQQPGQQGQMARRPRIPERNVGSRLHDVGQCSPCLLWWRRCCPDGMECLYCHLPHGRKVYKKIRPSERVRRVLRMRAIERARIAAQAIRSLDSDSDSSNSDAPAAQ